MHPTILVIGSLNTDIFCMGAPHLLGAGEQATGGTFHIAAGGKSRNIAQMISLLKGPGSVAMLGKTCRDPLGLWQVPYQALVDHKVNVDHIQVLPQTTGEQWPGIALIPVDTTGKNQVYVMPGTNAAFAPADIEAAESLFEQAGQHQGLVVFSLEMRLDTARAAMKLAKRHGLRVAVDPGGMQNISDPKEYQSIIELLSMGVDLIKPNEHEIRLLTRTEVVDFYSAELATHLFRKIGIPNTLVTMGAGGAFLFTPQTRTHIPVPQLPAATTHDETGCGDQTMAVLCALWQEGVSLEEAAQKAIRAGSLQFRRRGVQPLTRSELQ